MDNSEKIKTYNDNLNRAQRFAVLWRMVAFGVMWRIVAVYDQSGRTMPVAAEIVFWSALVSLIYPAVTVTSAGGRCPVCGRPIVKRSGFYKVCPYCKTKLR